ncbi:hypothetical protein LJC42_05060 [Eubacteriales bacterium OttesenSCG-928-K08]|nr:hypothetical protein [Eubacteriales bacterium OttesenSCG-928-K08]
MKNKARGISLLLELALLISASLFLFTTVSSGAITALTLAGIVIAGTLLSFTITGLIRDRARKHSA